MNIPGGIGSNSGYPSSLFNNDVYSCWQYTHLFNSWDHMVFRAPIWGADTAHKHGTDILSRIKFFGLDSQEAVMPPLALISQRGRQIQIYAEPLINILIFYRAGQDKLAEDNSYSNADVIAFHKELYRITRKGFNNFHIGIYTLNSGLTDTNKESLYYGHNPAWNIMDLMLNYSAGNFTTSNYCCIVDSCQKC